LGAPNKSEQELGAPGTFIVLLGAVSTIAVLLGAPNAVTCLSRQDSFFLGDSFVVASRKALARQRLPRRSRPMMKTKNH
jgi:hypothetical protein